ncbi:AMP-binding protein [Aliamphritea ceti]|uniref:AMP-binding protein n=1 Tax=Aliamphritea ceti TaxID=1524258 RepID=UPI0021C3D43B|nr:AMP-binding protein [Aliamphritea ceti]
MHADYQALSANAANHVSLSPISFLHRSADVYPDHEAVIYGDKIYTWQQTRDRCNRMASSLTEVGVGLGDTVAVLAFNTPEMFECHFSVPMTGGVINTINTRLDAETVGYILDHGKVRVAIVDRQLFPVYKAALEHAESRPQLIIVDDPAASERPNVDLPHLNYESLISNGSPDFNWQPPADEWQAIALNYTSGTTGRPKGVVYHHRGSYLMSMGTVIGWNLPNHPRYLYCVPMFHCNGWGHAWTMAAVTGTVICMRAFEPGLLFRLVEQHQISHFGGAPIILNMLANAPEEQQIRFSRSIKVMTAGAPPPAQVLARMTEFGFDVMHVYGLTETYGHILQAAPQQAWEAENNDTQAELKSRQGVRFPMTEAVIVRDPASGLQVPADGTSIGEILIRGNTCMKGYLNNPEATEEAFTDGWFHSGDLAVVHPDGYIQIKDRSKDLIISGGENISSVEVENTLYKHPAVGEAAVVAMPDNTWGEVPCAFVELKAEFENGLNSLNGDAAEAVTEAELIDFCSTHMARFKRPKRVIFGPLPKTATGKIQKHALRAQLKPAE